MSQEFRRRCKSIDMCRNFFIMSVSCFLDDSHDAEYGRSHEGLHRFKSSRPRHGETTSCPD